jgi:hypothetical protein
MKKKKLDGGILYVHEVDYPLKQKERKIKQLE